MERKSIGIIGSGSWATALAKIITDQPQIIHWYIRKDEDAAHILNFNHNPKYLSSVEFHADRIKIYTDLKQFIRETDILLLAIPSAFCHQLLSTISPDEFRTKIIFSGVKGIIPEYNLIVGEYLNRVFKIPFENIGVITGPCHAEEVALEKLSYLTLACSNVPNADYLAQFMRCRFIRVTTSDDIYGTELSAVLKNVIALACGIAHGLGYGDNYLSVLVSNAIQEIERFVKAVHPIDRDIKASAYLGDLLVTCYSQFSRNRMFGAMIGKGYSVKMAQLEMNMIAEGYYAVKCVHEINKTHGVDMPITEAVYNIVYNQHSPLIELKQLSERIA